MGDVFIFNSANDDVSVPGNDAAVRKQSVARPRGKGLADITNLPPKHRFSYKEDKARLMADQEQILQLRQENAALMKQLVERNKTIQLYAVELQKLRVNLQKSQQQNWQLAQANSQILAQLNAGKDTLKVLGHELACRNNLQAVRSSGLLEVKKTGQCQEIHSKKTTSEEAGVSSLADDNNDKPCCTNRRQLLRAQGQSVERVVAEDADDKRSRTRRQSSRFKSEDLEPAGTHDTNDVAFPACPQSVDKKPEICPMSETSQEGSEEALVSSSVGIHGSKCCITNAKPLRKAKRGSIVKDAFTAEKSETKRPRLRTRSSMLKSEEQEDIKFDAKFVISPQHDDKKLDCATSVPLSVDTKDVVKEEVDSSVVQEVRVIQDVNVTFQHEKPCSSGTGIKLQRGQSTAKGVSQVQKTEIKRPRTRRQSSRLRCKDEEASGCFPQDDDNVKPENYPVPLTVSLNAEKVEKEETDALFEQDKRSSVGRPLRRAAEKVQSYKEIPLKVKMRRPE